MLAHNVNIRERAQFAAKSGKRKPIKDEQGRNGKKHLSTFKYFVKKNVTNPDAEKEKMYITADGDRLEGPDALRVAQAEAQL